MAGRSDIMVRRTFYQIAMMTLVVSLVWVAVGIYQATTKTAEVGVDKAMLDPINPNMDQSVIQQLSGRIGAGQSIPESDTINEDGAR